MREEEESGVRFLDDMKECGAGKRGGNHTGIIHQQQAGDGPGHDVAVLIALSHVTLIHSTENAGNGTMPGFVCVLVEDCVQQHHQLKLIRVWLLLHQLHPSLSAYTVIWSVGSLLSVTRSHVPASLITQASDSLIERGQSMNIFQ